MFRLDRFFQAAAAVILLGSASASAQTCSSIAFTSGFGSTTIDIVPDTPASAVATVRGSCHTSTTSDRLFWCLYIQPTGDQPRNDSSFHLTASPDSRLAWSMGVGGLLVQREGATSGTNGHGCIGSVNSSCVTSKTFTLSYLPRQQQDRVRPGTYTNTYTLIAKYASYTGNQTVTQLCSSPPAGSPLLTSTFTVTANVLTKCQLENIQNIDFGSWGAASAASASPTGVRAFGNVGVRCTYETPYTLTIGDGLHASGGVRRMQSGTDVLSYQLFQPGCTTPWTTTSGLSGTGTTVNALNNHQVCAQLVAPLAIAPPPGTYTDTVVLTVTF